MPAGPLTYAEQDHSGPAKFTSAAYVPLAQDFSLTVTSVTADLHGSMVRAVSKFAAKGARMIGPRCERCEELLSHYHEAVARLVETGKRVAVAARDRECDLFEKVWNEAQAAHLECMKLRKCFVLHFESHIAELYRFRADVRLTGD